MTKINSEAEKRMVRMYKNGKTMMEIAKEFSVNTGTVHLHLRKFIPKEERQRRQHVASFTVKQAEKFCLLYKKGMSSVEIGDKMGFGADVVLYALKKKGIDTSKGGKYLPKVDSSKLEKMKDIYQKTGSILETAKKLNLHPSSVHSRLTKEGVVKKKALNQDMIKLKYEKITSVLTTLFKRMGLDVEYIQDKYNGPGPDMIIRDGQRRIIVEHKATVRRSFYWLHGIEEAIRNREKFGIDDCWVVTTASRPKKTKNEDNLKLIFFEDLEKLLQKNDLQDLIPEIEFISNTPSV